MANTDWTRLLDGYSLLAIKDWVTANYAAKSHTHSYAGSSSAGGAATSANKLNTNAGSATNPVYFSGGVPVACTYSLNKTVPADAVFTDHTYNFSGTTFYSGNSGNAEHNANNAVKNGAYYYSSNGPTTTLGATTSDGALYVQSYSDSWVGQIAQDYRNGRLFVRGKNNGTWTNWIRVANYNEIPSVSNATITIKQTGLSDQTFTLNGSAATITLADTNTWRPLGTGANDAAAGNHNHNGVYQDSSDILTAFEGGMLEAYLDADYGFVKLVNDGSDNPAFVIDTTAYLALSGGTLTGRLKWSGSTALPSATNLGVTAEYILCIKAFADGGDTFYETKSNFLSGYATTTWVNNQGFLKTAVTKLGTRTGNITIANLKSDLGLGSAAYTNSTAYAASDHNHTLSIASGGSSPTTLAANTTYTLTAGGSTLVFKTPPASSAFYSNQYNQVYYFTQYAAIALTNTTNNGNVQIGFSGYATTHDYYLESGHNINTFSKYFIMNVAQSSDYVGSIIFGRTDDGYDNIIVSRSDYAPTTGYTQENLDTLRIYASDMYINVKSGSTLYSIPLGRKCHTITITNGTGTSTILFNIKNTNTGQITSIASVCNALYYTGHRNEASALIANGIYGSYTKPIIGIYATSSSSGLNIVYMNSTTKSTASITSGTVADNTSTALYEV